MTGIRAQRSKRLPIYRNAGFLFDTVEEAAEVFAKEEAYPQSSDRFSYSRYGSPNVAETESSLAEIEGSSWGVLCASGMAAIDTALSAFQCGADTGTWLFFSELYGGTNDYIDAVLARKRGIEIARFSPTADQERYDILELEELLDRLNPTLLYFEPITNPLLIVSHGNRIIQLAKARKMTVVVDNTFATPLLWRPLDHGADVVVHSATKYLGGHGNLTAGVVCGNSSDIRKAAMLYRKYVGNILSPDDAYRLGTQAQTFALRFRRQCENAARLARTMATHPAVERVRYPGLESHTTHPEAVHTFGERGFGAMLNVDFAGGRTAADTFVEAASETISYVPTLGDPTTIMLHVSTVWGKKRFPYPGMIRMSVGFEPYDQLESGVLRALDEVSNAS